MENRLAIIAVIVENVESVPALNELLHRYGDYIIGRMGLPYRQRKLSVISVVIEAPQNVISALSGSIGRLKGVNSKTVYSNVSFHDDGNNRNEMM